MPRQTGPIVFTGTVGELSFYKDKVHGYLIRSKGGPTKQQIKKRESMEVVRQNNNEFGKASTYGALLRSAFRPLVVHCKEYSMSRRLQSIITYLIKMDASKDPGKRDIVKEHLIALQAFELNQRLSYQKFFKRDVEIEVSRKMVAAKGQCTISKASAKMADYYKVISVLAGVDFGKKKFINDVKESKLLPCRGIQTFEFNHSLPETDCLFYGLVICFYKKNGGELELIIDEGMKAGFISFVSME